MKGSGECRVVFRSSIQFIDGLTALLGPCYAGARCRVKKIDAVDSRSGRENARGERVT